MRYLSESTIFPIERAFKIISARSDAILRKTIGCSRREVWVLLCVTEEPCSQRQLGDFLGIHPNGLVKLLDVMEQRELLRRVRRVDDRREQIVEATEEGKRRLKIYIERRPKLLLQVFSPLNETQIEQWRDLATQVLVAAPNVLITESDS